MAEDLGDGPPRLSCCFVKKCHVLVAPDSPVEKEDTMGIFG
jgi:hypothetical protein